MTRLVLVVFLCGLLVILPRTAIATEECDPDKPENCAQHMLKGQSAPFAGQLLTPSLAIDLGLKADRCDYLIQIEIDYEKEVAETKLKLERQLRESSERHHVLEMEAMQREVNRWKDVADVSFYERPWFVAMLTTIVIGGLLVGAGQVLP